MSKLIKTTATSVVMDFLNSKGIIALNLLGAIEHTPELVLYVDDLTTPTGVVGAEDYFKYIVTNETQFLDDYMETFCQKDDYYGFTGIDKTLADHILTKNVKLHWRNDCNLYYLPEAYTLPDVDPRVASLELKHADEVNNFYEFKGEYSLGQIKEDIKNRPSSCITIEGELASWVVIHRDDTMGIMYTKEAYRQKHLAYLVSVDLMHKVRGLGKLPFLQIATKNTASQGLAAKAGLKKANEIVSWFGIIVGDLPMDD